MSGNAPDFASAALRHMRDAEHLVAPGEYTSRDQAWHLAGFAHECARKALVGHSWVPKLLGHHFNGTDDLVIEIAIALDPRAGRFPVRDWASRYPAIRTWLPEHRYDRTGSSDPASHRPVEELIVQGRLAVDASIVALFLEGTLEVESLA